MSDRHAAEKLFSQLLQEYREDMLPNVVYGWDKLSPDEKHVITRINNFIVACILLLG